RHWNPRTSKMSLAVGIHRVSMASDSQFVALDGEPINVHRPVVVRKGEYWVPGRFLTRALGLAVNSEITVHGAGAAISVVKLGALVMSVGLEERPGTTVAVVALNDRAEFAVRSRERGRIDFFLSGAALLDSLDVLEGVGLVSSVELAETEAGVNAVVRVAPSATAYDAQMHTNPPRLEVIVVAEREQSVPSPLLKGMKNLLGTGAGPFEALDDGVVTVMIDPGHGGADSGRAGRSGLLEKDVALAIAERIAPHLRREGFYVFMTRSSDSRVPLKRRAEIANLAGADIFVSIHCGAWHSASASGFRVSYYVPTPDDVVDKSSAGTRGLRRGSHGVRRGGVGDLRWGGLQENLTDESRALARAVRGRMSGALPNYDRGVGGADLAVLAGCAMPAILVEAGFITNASDAALLADAGFQEDVAGAIARGLVEYSDSFGGRNQ
ncbi:MAG: N-acetylmuramoyl-L-alanine amidase, partial [Candidatus Eisenbacteria sp.]|nr:N-acetylmuramoyl-L-alanine amidase [Candidatus Eisenbacteria bacterium]